MVLRLTLLFLMLPACALAQPFDGIVDRDADTRVQIGQLETILRNAGDMAAERQAVMLQWLASLYEYVGDDAGVESSYMRILAFFPNDVGTMNRYAEYLINKANNVEKAESVLVAASQWGRFTDARALNRAKTYELLAGVEMENGDYAASERHALLAIELYDDEASKGARRVLAQTLHRTGAHDAAVEEYLELIALDRGTNLEDINSAKLIVAKSARYRDSDINRLVEEAISRREAERLAAIEAEGAELVRLETEGGDVVLEGTLRRRGTDAAVLLIAARENTRSLWTPYAQLLGIDEISSLSLDLRGQGDSRSETAAVGDEPAPDVSEQLPDDIISGYHYLDKTLRIPRDRVVIVGESDACPLIEKAIRRGRLDVAVVYLSPVFDTRDRALADAISFRPNAKTLLYYSKEDLLALQSTSYFKRTKELPQLEIRVLEDAGHGIEILRRDPGALESFQAWLRRTTGVESPPSR